MKTRTQVLTILTLLTGSAIAAAQTATTPPLQNIVQLSAQGAVEVQQDLLSVTLSTRREGADPNAVQSQLKAALESALSEARSKEHAELMAVRTGSFSLSPRWGRDGKTNGWQGQVELILEGKDFSRITATAGKVQSLTVAQVSFGLSRKERVRVASEAQSQAIENFKSQASDIARSFGFSAYVLREVSVNSDEQGDGPRPRMMAMKSMSSISDAPIPVEVGKTSVVVSVAGSVQLK